MALSLSVYNILQFFTFISPIFISLFLLVQSALAFNLKGPVYMIGGGLAYALGIILKTMLFYSVDNPKITAGQQPSFQRTPDQKGWPMLPGHTNWGMPDYCNVFEGPFHHNAFGLTSMPSLNAIFHSFTFSYILSGIIANPNHPGVLFIITLGVIGLINMIFRYTLYCDKFMDIIVGIILGGASGVGWYFAVNAWNPTYTYFGKDDNTKKCTLGKTKFRCTQDKG